MEKHFSKNKVNLIIIEDNPEKSFNLNFKNLKFNIFSL